MASERAIRFGKAHNLRSEWIIVSRRVAQDVYHQREPSQEDLVVLRGNTEALIELAEESNG